MGVCISFVPVFGQGLGHHHIQRRGQLHIDVGRIGVGLADNLLDDFEVIGAIKGPAAGQQLVEHHACRKQIRTRVNGLALHLLGRHVFQRAHHGALGAGGIARILNSGHAKIGELGPAAGLYQQVGGLDVAVNNVLPVRVVQRRQQIAHDAQGLL